MPRKNKKLHGLLTRRNGLVLAVLLVATAAFLVTRHSSHNNKSSTVGEKTNSSVTVKSKSGTETTTNTPSVSSTQGAVTDKKGSSVADTPSAEWTTSKTGTITLHSPTSGSTLKSGDTISGTAKVSSIQYRLVDNAAGIVAQGGLSVVNGKFSGTIAFSHSSSSGELELYTNSGPGTAEQNNLKVSVNF